MPGEHTFREILEQPAVWQRVLDTLKPRLEALGVDDVEEVVFVGCGSSYHLSEAGALIFADLTGARVRYAPASEVFLSPHAIFHRGDRVAVVALSRTGETTEVLKAVNAFKRLRDRRDLSGSVYGFTCTPDSALTHACDETVVIPSREESLVMTQGFTGTLLALELWAARLSLVRDPLPSLSALDAAGQAVLDRAPILKEVASYRELSRFVFLGSGGLHAIAKEGALKMQEMALSPAVSAYHSLEYRHGPKSTLGPDTLVTLLVSEHSAAYDADLLAELKALGAKTLVICGDESPEFEAHADYLFSVGAYPDPVRALLYPPLLQLLAYHRAMQNGHDPDAPRHLTRSVVF